MIDPLQPPGAFYPGEDPADTDSGRAWLWRWCGRRWVRNSALLAGPLLVVALVGFVLIDRGIVDRFEQRRSALPSRTYSAPFEIDVREGIEASELLDRLTTLGYRQVDGEPSQPGEYRRRKDIWTVYLRSATIGSDQREAFRLELRVRRNRISRATDLSSRKPLRTFALEPEPLFTYYAEHMEDRRWTPLERVPGDLVAALEVVEDRRFRRHFGLDVVGIGRAMFVNAGQGRVVQGGSTITQQLVKNLYGVRRRTMRNKLREAVAAVALELHYDKDAILEAYLNEVYLGQRGPVAISGIGDASHFFFGMPVEQLDLARSALLVGMIRNPGGYNPRAHPDRALDRRNLVLESMRGQDRIDEDRMQATLLEPLHVVVLVPTNQRLPWAAAYLAEATTARSEEVPLSQAGYSLHTTFDPAIQHAASEALRRGLERIERRLGRDSQGEPLEGAVVVLRPSDGAILGLIGGRDYARSQFNRATRARRPAGSALKPFVYLAALERAQQDADFAFTLATLLDDSPIHLDSGGKTWSPANYDGQFRGPVSARQALEQSLNVPAVRAATHVGLDRIVELLRRVGIEQDLQPLPSLALGAADVTPLELAAVFATLANGGSRVQPHGLVGLQDREGNPRRLPTAEPQPVVDASLTYLMTNALRGVVERGTARSAADWGFRGLAAGKTGSSDDLRDAWFVGYTPDVLVAVWVGYDDNRRIGLPGASAALPIWVGVMQAIGAETWRGFPRPRGIGERWVDPLSGQLAHYRCPDAVRELFVSGTEPDEPCTVHERRRRRSFWSRKRRAN